VIELDDDETQLESHHQDSYIDVKQVEWSTEAAAVSLCAEATGVSLCAKAAGMLQLSVGFDQDGVGDAVLRLSHNVVLLSLEFDQEWVGVGVGGTALRFMDQDGICLGLPRIPLTNDALKRSLDQDGVSVVVGVLCASPN
jgi:hypothetical protein